MRNLLVSQIKEMNTNEVISLMSENNIEILDNMVVVNVYLNRQIFVEQYKKGASMSGEEEYISVDEYFKWYLDGKITIVLNKKSENVYMSEDEKYFLDYYREFIK